PPSYRSTLNGIINHAGMRDHVTFHGSVSQEQLVSHYMAAAVFCCLSDHDGVCVPVIEAMNHDLPVIAFSCTAVTETVGDGGLLLTEKSPLLVASAIHRVSNDDALAQRLRQAGRQRAKNFDSEITQEKFRRQISNLILESL
ncbi:MAG: glycosyltransferase, partial [Acidimicrobiales bacterium]|nr:glycosyltransferase [Acidimicrobiales bacterium]